MTYPRPQLARAILALLSVVVFGNVLLAEEVAEPTAQHDDIFIRLDDPALSAIAARYANEQTYVEQDHAPLPPADMEAYVDGPIIDGVGDCGEYWGWTILPVGLVYRSYLAGVNEARLGLRVAHIADNDDQAGTMFDGNIGGRKGLIRYGNRNPYCAEGFQLDVEASAVVRLNFDEDMDVQATDYRVGVPFTYGWGNKQIKFGYWHVSSHLGDEFILRNAPNFTRFNYSKDSLVLGYSQYVTDDFRVYAEASWAFYYDVAEPWEFQFGFEKAPRFPTGIHGAPFYAFNVHLREELNYGGDVTFQTGWAWRADEGAGLMRIGLHYYNGKSSQRSFWNQFEEQIGFGIWYDY